MNSKIIDFLRSTRKDQFKLLEDLVLQSSHSLDKAGVDAVGDRIKEALNDCALTLFTDQQEIHGNNLIFSSAACSPGISSILLLGHMDTVFPPETDFNFYKEDEDRAYGPGIIDMKGGLVTAVFLLKALQHLNLLESVPLIFICNSDEEIGSPQSTEIIRKYAADSICGLVFECGGLNGEVVTGRKGKTGYFLETFGKSGHAAFTGKNGKASAIVELAHMVIQLEQLNDPVRNIVLNVGKVQGGSGVNVVPDRASAEIDTRYTTVEDGTLLGSEIEKIASFSNTPGTRSQLSRTNSRYPMEQSEENCKLFDIYRLQAEKLGLKVSDELRSGVSDANTIAECKIPVLDGLGPIGDFDHSENEYMMKNSFVERSVLATHLVMKIWENHNLSGKGSTL